MGNIQAANNAEGGACFTVRISTMLPPRFQEFEGGRLWRVFSSFDDVTDLIEDRRFSEKNGYAVVKESIEEGLRGRRIAPT